MSASQNDSGRAFEYSLSYSLAEKLVIPLELRSISVINKQSFEEQAPSEKINLIEAADHAVEFLIQNDLFFQSRDNVFEIKSMTDKSGEEGDVRDIIITNQHGVTRGISAKNRHHAIKHSRLSQTIDFGKVWMNSPCSAEYFSCIRPIFDTLKKLKSEKLKWSEIESKADKFYLPILHCFCTEIERILTNNPDASKALLEYLLGRFDFYKIVKENGSVKIDSFNLRGKLGWGKQLPTAVSTIQIGLVENSTNKVMLIFNQGWQISFRIHNASTYVEPSLKFDIQPVGFPSSMGQHEIRYKS